MIETHNTRALLRMAAALALGLAPVAAQAHHDAPAPPPVVVLPGTLVDHVAGVTLDANGQIERFSGIVIGEDGRITALLHAGEPRPHTSFALDGKGASVLPGLVARPTPLMRYGLALITSDASAGPLPPPRPEDRDLALVTAQHALLARGITAVVDAGTTIEDWQTFRRAGDAGRLALRIVCYADGPAQMVLIGGPGPTPWLYEGRLRLNGLWLDADARDDTNAAIRLKNLMSRAAMDHFQVAVATHGAKPLHDTLDAIDDLAHTYEGDRRWRVELGALVGPDGPDAEDAPRLAAPGIVAETTGLAIGDVTTSLPASLPMLIADTMAPARAAMAETQFGRLAPGLWADFVLVSGDPLNANAAAGNGASARLMQTWIGGHPVWTAPGASPTGPLVAPDAKPAQAPAADKR